MAVNDLPRSIIAGGCVTDPAIGFPLSLAEVSAKGRPEEAYPVLIIGTQVLATRTLLARHCTAAQEAPL
jgi:hypothetical protein